MSDPVTPARARRARDPRSQDLMVRYSKIPHTPYGIRNSEIRNANTPIPHHGAGLSWPIIRGCEWSGRMERFRPFRFQPRVPRFRNLMRKHPSDALATPF
jgi:hypothetical protein